MRATPHERFSSTITLTPSGVSDFARAAGDLNPLHHDPVAAARTRYKRPIASATQTTAQLMGLTATHFSKRGEMVGLDFSFRFKKPIYADETIELFDVISISAGQRGLQIILAPADYLRATNAKLGPISREKPRA